MDFDTVLAVHPTTIFRLLPFYTDVHFSYFSVTWFRVRTRVHWVAYVIGEFLLRYIRVIHPSDLPRFILVQIISELD